MNKTEYPSVGKALVTLREYAAFPNSLPELRMAIRVVFVNYLKLEQDRRIMKEAIEQAIEDNLHLADGEDCTLIGLKKALEKIQGGAR